MPGPKWSSVPDERRAHPRYPVLWSATLSAESEFDRYVLSCQISNISISGLHVLVERTLEPGRSVSLRIDRVGTFRGRVVRCEGDSLGIAFEDSPERVASLIRDKV